MTQVSGWWVVAAMVGWLLAALFYGFYRIEAYFTKLRRQDLASRHDAAAKRVDEARDAFLEAVFRHGAGAMPVSVTIHRKSKDRPS